MTDRKKPGWAFWATVVLLVLNLYALLWGPVCWLWHSPGCPDWFQQVTDFIYYPMDRLHWGLLNWDGPGVISEPLHWYWRWWTGY
jgi:hypothetical protein